jgi:hypothetical protein
VVVGDVYSKNTERIDVKRNKIYHTVESVDALSKPSRKAS